MTVFNPRTETNGYVMLAPSVGVFALHARAAGAARTVMFLAMIALGLGADNYPGHYQTDLWLKPALGLIFLSWLVLRMIRGPSLTSSTPGSGMTGTPPSAFSFRAPWAASPQEPPRKGGE